MKALQYDLHFLHLGLHCTTSWAHLSLAKSGLESLWALLLRLHLQFGADAKIYAVTVLKTPDETIIYQPNKLHFWHN